MGYYFIDLDQEVRVLMMNEVNADIATNNTYKSKRFIINGDSVYVNLLIKSIQSGTEESLAASIASANILELTEPRNRSGNVTFTVVPKDANETLANTEFNNYYMRALCVKSIQDDMRLLIYRAKEVQTPRPDSQLQIGEHIDAASFLDDLRNLEANEFKYPKSGWSGGANSGKSVRIDK